ncbi:hypothetical protein Bca52824_013779 [Brassica carinata]|uniref:GHMP kinase N-terminal domain-containing protein n=1 Tax=Brassica carinata TaxID=52824 RepID=A0A8X7VZI8_BRACI|nr:hypothetical protein Bca52824_013779 [Brassica carinata]
MANITAQTQTANFDIEDGRSGGCSRSQDSPRSPAFIPFVQKVFGEFVGTFSLVFAGCSAIVVNDTYGKPVTLPGIALTWGLTVMVMTYSIGHISGAHFNPAITIALASSRKFPLKQVPGYIAAQVLGSTLAMESLRLLFHLDNNGCSLKGAVYLGSHPSSSNTAAFVVEFIATFNLLFVISAVATDKRANKSFAGIAIGATVVLDILFGGPISGASMNPARSLAPAYIWGCYKNVWIYIVAPVVGALAGLDITILSSNDSYSYRNQPSQIHGATCKPEVAKTGLGSSASMTTAVVAALLHYLGVVDLSDPCKDGKFGCSDLDVIHMIAQTSHCLAQGKVGSGFDVSCAVYGSQRYVRFSPELLSYAQVCHCMKLLWGHFERKM